MHDLITPLILTYNEAPNIERTLARLGWAKRVVVVDSFSDDGTPALAVSFPNVSLVSRKFDNHATQWNFGLHETGIETEWVLALDADYVLGAELVQELGGIRPAFDVNGYEARFVYCIEGQPLRSSLYPPVTVLYRRAVARYAQDGHTQRVRVSGRILPLRGPIYHDDRKPMSRWITSQVRYMELEAERIVSSPANRLALKDHVRRLIVVSPVAVLLYCLLIRGLLFDGRAGMFYAVQRAFAEMLLSLLLLRRMLP